MPCVDRAARVVGRAVADSQDDPDPGLQREGRPLDGEGQHPVFNCRDVRGASVWSHHASPATSWFARLPPSGGAGGTVARAANSESWPTGPPASGVAPTLWRLARHRASSGPRRPPGGRTPGPQHPGTKPGRNLRSTSSLCVTGCRRRSSPRVRRTSTRSVSRRVTTRGMSRSPSSSSVAVRPSRPIGS
jgi:hypothetical protein